MYQSHPDKHEMLGQQPAGNLSGWPIVGHMEIVVDYLHGRMEEYIIQKNVFCHRF